MQTTEPVAVSAEDLYRAFRGAMEYDPWLFSLVICKRDPKAKRHHRPLLYIYTRRVALLCLLLSDPAYDGPITDQLRADFRQRGIDWTNPQDFPRVLARLRRVNIRMPRSSGKSTFADDGDLWDAVVDPDITISIGSKSDPAVQKRLATMGEIIRSPQFAMWFHDRIPDDPRTEVTESGIWLKGRTRFVTEATIEGRGLLSQWFGSHFRKNRRDDIVGTESGEASVEDALRHLANMTALRDLTGWVQDVFVGTVNGEEDDHSMLSADESVLSIVVPIEEHEGGTTLENVYTDGKLTMPEWFDRETVNQIKAEAKANPKYGPIWLLQNHYMAAHRSGATVFTTRMVEKAKYRWVWDDKRKRELIARPKKGRDGTQRDSSKPDFKPEDWFYLDIKTLSRTSFGIGIDQSVSEDATSDRWALICVCIDWEGVFYVLDGLAEHGYGSLLDALIPFDKRNGKPYALGVDANATQAMTIEWVKRSAEFKDLARRVTPIRSGGDAKELNIRNWVQARMLTHELYINPRLHDYSNELLRYRPRKPDGTRTKNPKDDQLDATWMAMTLPRRPMSQEEIDEATLEEQIAEMKGDRGYDPATGPITDDWMDALSGFGRVA